MLTPAERQTRHRQRKYAEWAAMPPVPCVCGCGTLIPPINKNGKPSQYVHGHNKAGKDFLKGSTPWNKGKSCPQISEAQRGKKRAPEAIAKRTATRLANNDGVYQRKSGWKHTPETIEHMREANKAKGAVGPKNPFYGKTHTKEARAKMSAKLSGDKHPLWKGGTGTLPYGPEFTRKFKKLIRERDNYTCQHCGKVQQKGDPTFPLHHKDRNKANNDPSNLVTLCHSCHVWFGWHKE